MVDKHIKRYALALAIRDLQIETTLRYYYMPIRIAKTKITQHMPVRVRTKQVTHLLGTRMLFYKIAWKFLIKVNVQLPYNPAITSLTIYQRNKNLCLYKIGYSNIHSCFICIAQNWNQPRFQHLNDLTNCGTYIT